MKTIKLFLVFCAFCMLLSTPVWAVSNTDNTDLCFGNVTFTKNGQPVDTYESSSVVDIQVSAANNTAYDTPALLIVLSYDTNGKVHNIRYDCRLLSSGTSAILKIEGYTTPAADKGVCDVTAFVMDKLDSVRQFSRAAHMLCDSTDLAYIKIDGKIIEGFEKGKESYIIKNRSDMKRLEVAASDNSAKVEMTEFVHPGIVSIRVTSQFGTEKNIKITLFDKEEDTYQLSSISYIVDGTEYEVAGFSPSRVSYSVELPDNTKFVKVKGISTAGEVSYYVNNIMNTTGLYGDNRMSYGTMASNARTSFNYIRPALNEMIPIKNESTNAIIKAESTLGKTEYTIRFNSRQPRLTSFEYVGAAGDSYKPVFVSGAALYNDNGSVSATDRTWACSNISNNLLGASAFIFPVYNRTSNDGNKWWNGNTTGIYFTFTADTPGTILVFSNSGFSNSEYTGDKHGEGWASAESSGFKLTLPDGATDLREVNKTWNDYGDSNYFIGIQQWRKDSERAGFPGVSSVDSSEISTYFSGGAYGINQVYYRTFLPGEKVSIYHTGKQGTHGAIAMPVIVWKTEKISITALEELSINIFKGDDIREKLPSAIKATTEEGDVEVNVVWDYSGFDSQKEGEQAIYGTVTVPEGFVLSPQMSGAVQINVTVNKREITGIAPVFAEMLTGDGAADVLPDKITAATAVGELELNVIWDTKGFNTQSVGYQQIDGILEVPDGFELSEGLTNVIQAEVAVYHNDEHLLLCLESNNNTGRNILNTASAEWLDFSRYKNNIHLNTNASWTDNGLSVISGPETPAILISDDSGDKLCRAINSYNFTIEFEVESISNVSGSDLPLMSSENDTFAIFRRDSNSKVNFKWASKLTPLQPAVSDAELINKVNRIVVKNSENEKTIIWYVDGVEKSRKTYTDTAAEVDKLVLGGTYGAGSCVWKSLKIYDCPMEIQ